MAKHLSPTNVATYYHNQCHLYLHNAYHRPHDIIKATPKDVSPLSAAQFQRGLEWESRLFRWLEVQNKLVRLDATSPPKTAAQIRDLFVETGNALDVESSRYIVNLTFKSPAFEHELGLVKGSRLPVAFGVAKPDLVKITRVSKDVIEWEVIDAKASSILKSSHNAQIGFYHLCLETLIASVPVPKRIRIVPSIHASIWMPSAEGEEFSVPVSTPVSLLLPPLRTFLFKTLPEQILNLQREQVEWHLNPSCQGCEFFDSCKTSTTEDGRLGMIPNLSVSEARFIREVVDISVHHGLLPAKNRLTDIEELDSLVKKEGIDKLEKTYAATAKRFQRLLGVQKTSIRQWSPQLEAALTDKPQLTRLRVFTFPRAEEVAIFFSVIIDISDNTIGAFCCSLFSHKETPQPGGLMHIEGAADEFIPKMANMLRSRLEKSPKARTQVYTYSNPERAAINMHLIKAALFSDTEEERDDVRLCLGALCEGTSLLLTAFQPQILSGVLLTFLSKKNNLTKGSLQLCCERLGLQRDGTIEDLRKRIEGEQKRLAELGGRAGDELHRREVGQLGKVVVLKREIERIISLPIPGFVDLPQTAQALLAGRVKCEPDDVLFGQWAKRRGPSSSSRLWMDGLKDRNRCMRLLIENVRQRIRNAGLTEQILLNEAKALEVGMMDICESEKLRKLMFMLQFEVVLRLQELWQNRLDGCPNAPLLRYVGAEKRGATWENIFDIVSGALEPPVEERAFHDWLLVEEPEGPSDHLKVPPEIYFDDLSLSGLFFPLTKYTKPKWEEQHPIVKEKVFIANVREIRLATSDTDVSRPRSQAVIQISFTGKTFQKGKLYRISPRHVDFNLSRVLQNLVMMDFQGCLTNEQVPFMKLINDPQEFAESESFCDKPAEIKREQEIARGLNELENLGNVHAKALKLKDSQHRAARRMLFKRLSVVWGPPGTGKTYTLALSTLRMIEVLGSTAIKQCPIILVTAMTHAAIEAIVGKLNSLIGHYRDLKERDTSWLDMISLERVLSGTTHQAPKVKKVYIYAGTTYQLYKFCEKSRLTANVIIIDEAGQLALGTAALVIRWLSHNGKLVLAGDHQQLAPILATVYPEPPEERPLFGSVLDLLMDRKRGGLKIARTMSDPNSRSQDDERDGVVVQLLENFR
ncbi:hypothetical protein M408DRAFT_279472 [Serendipita vermifera MAFF 305830]|uniref:DNA2/NAM7 helicase helicase domain-containing protein n=1 Tax=Serendipita vermifera MAFF 305830 TaxID=933852 RepID=A0A0C3ARU5_SERVB|nr:hypothetical protein M408DRAFT_279472 [Serendipita vermifera MAFF 305830]